jgi:ubiquinone biosynthesis protein
MSLNLDVAPRKARWKVSVGPLRCLAMIVVGLFVGSSIVYYAGMKPIIFGIPVIGFMGYVVAFALGVWIVIDIYLKGRKTKKR